MFSKMYFAFVYRGHSLTVSFWIHMISPDRMRSFVEQQNILREC